MHYRPRCAIVALAALLLLQALGVTSKALDQNFVALNNQWQGQQGITPVIQKRYDPSADDAGYDDHHHHHPEPGYWKKKLIWKPGYKKIWKPAEKKIWKSAWKKIYKPIWVPTKRQVWRDIQVPDYKKFWKPVWKPIQVSGWKEIKVPAWKKIYKAEWKPIKVKAWKEIQVPAWKKQYYPEWIKVGIPGEHFHGTDNNGWQYTSHDLWKKKLIWKVHWQKIWKSAKKEIWVDDKKLVWREDWVKIWKPAKKQIWWTEKKLEWVEGIKQIWRTEKKEEWIPDKKLEWKEAWKQIWVPGTKKIWVEAWEKIWKPVWISEWFPAEDHHHPPSGGWEDRKDQLLPEDPRQRLTRQSDQQPLPQLQQVGQIKRQDESRALDTITADLVPPPSDQQSTWKIPSR